MSDETEIQPGVEDASSASSSAPAPDTADTQAPAPDGEHVASPPDAPAGKEPQDDRSSLLDIVKSAVAPKDPKTPLQGEEPKAAEPDKSSPEKQTQAQPDAALEADPTEAELKTMVPRTKARVEKLLSQRNEERRRVAELQPAAENWTHFDKYLKEHQLAAEDVNLLLGVGAALRRGDFQAFYDGVMPYVERAKQELGMALPPDLQAKVDAGEIAFDAAKEFSKTRLMNARLQGQVHSRSTRP